MRILLAGGTGRVGRVLTARASEAGHAVRVLSRHAADRQHHVVLSIAGVDRFPTGYYRAKLAQEAAAERIGVGHTVARVTQFHDFAALMLRRARLGPLVLAPRLHLQPVHLRDVADHLLGLLAEGPAGRPPDLGGPRPEELPDMLRRYTTTIGARVRVLTVPLLGPTRGPNEARVLRPEDGVRGRLTFDDWLEEATP